MSKTYHRNRKKEAEAYVAENGSQFPGLGFSVWSPTYQMVVSKFARHPNRCAKSSLQREFNKYGIKPMTDSWKRILGSAFMQSSRLKTIRQELSHSRRCKMKAEVSRIIKQALESED